MISSAATSAIAKMKARWESVLSINPAYELDGTWPAIGILDSLTFLLRGQEAHDEIAQELIKGAAASIGVIAHDAWRSAGCDVRLEDLEEGITLIATSGKGIEAGQKVIIRLERELTRILLETKGELPVMSGFTRHVASQENFLSLFAIGAATGLSPFAEGPWREETIETFTESVGAAVRLLARQAAEYYARVYPDETLGQVPELYLRGLVFPPMLFQEDYPARRAVKSLLVFCDEYKVPRQKVLTLAANLARSPDEQLSSAGIATYAALMERYEPEFAALCSSKGAFLGILRPAMCDAREHYKLERDWMDAKSFGPEQLKRIELELRLGFFPWVKLRKEKVAEFADDPALAQLVRALSYFNLNDSKSAADRIIELTPNDIEVRIQRIYLDVIAGDTARAEEGLKSLLTEPEAESSPAVLNLMGLVQLVLTNIKAATFHLDRARSFATTDAALSADIGNNYAWAQMCDGNFATALDALDLAIDRTPTNLVALLNKRSALHELGKSDQAEALLDRMVELAPFDRRIFTGVMQRLLVPKAA